MRKVFFAGDLPELVLSGQKSATWRVAEDIKRRSNTKDAQVGDGLSLCRNNSEEFARAKVTSVKYTTFGELTDEDWVGHEEFSSEQEMYDTYSAYYDMNILPSTKLQIIRFKLV